MRRRTAYRVLALFALTIAASAAVLAGVALGLAHLFEAGAAALCAAVFFVPGLVFLNQWHRLYARDVALAHAAALAKASVVMDGQALAAELHVPPEDARKILRTAVREGLLQGTVDEHGRFVSSTAAKCPRCGTPVPRSDAEGSCPSCGAPLAGGE